MGNQGSQKRGSSDDGPGVPSEVIRQKLLQLDAMLKEPAPEIDDMLWTTGEGTSCARGEAYAEVVIGTSKIATPQLVSQIDAIASQSKRLGQHEVMRRLAMGDDGIQANRVLHLAFKKEDGSLIGVMSSTYQPPWTEEGCGHWGLLAVHPDHQGQGVASALVRAGEVRLAAVCTEIQMEYRYTYGDPDSEKLLLWYEGRLGFICSNGCEQYNGKDQPDGPAGETEFRMCRKRIPVVAQRAGERRRLEEVRAFVADQLQAAEQAEARQTAQPNNDEDLEVEGGDEFEDCDEPDAPAVD